MYQNYTDQFSSLISFLRQLHQLQNDVSAQMECRGQLLRPRTLRRSRAFGQPTLWLAGVYRLNLIGVGL